MFISRFWSENFESLNLVKPLSIINTNLCLSSFECALLHCSLIPQLIVHVINMSLFILKTFRHVHKLKEIQIVNQWSDSDNNNCCCQSEKSNNSTLSSDQRTQFLLDPKVHNGTLFKKTHHVKRMHYTIIRAKDNAQATANHTATQSAFSVKLSFVIFWSFLFYALYYPFRKMWAALTG